MLWESVEAYKELVELHPTLKEKAQRDAFIGFLDRLWTRPSTLKEFSRAYMEFTKPEKLTFPKLNARPSMQDTAAKPAKSRRSRRSRSRRSRKKKAK
ncbi:MAG: hypothetical protein P1S60_12525 [Anaerolineae bacterium]|nr:hypothetical protein [Anaerolineae bacterium]